MERAIRYRAFSFQSLERILSVQAKPKAFPPSLAESYPPPLTDDAGKEDDRTGPS